MNANFTQQEIMVVTGTTFSTQEFAITSDGLDYNHLTEKEKLEVACWNGLLPAMLPEVFGEKGLNRTMYLWEIREGSSFIELEMGDVYMDIEKQFSINPYSFMSVKSLS